jgi:hypothetical protein
MKHPVATAAAIPTALRELLRQRGLPETPANWTDLTYLISAYRSFRWTGSVMPAAATRYGPLGRRIELIAQVRCRSAEPRS